MLIKKKNELSLENKCTENTKTTILSDENGENNREYLGEEEDRDYSKISYDHQPELNPMDKNKEEKSSFSKKEAADKQKSDLNVSSEEKVEEKEDPGI